MENTLLRECQERFRTEIEHQEITQGRGCAAPHPAAPQHVHLSPLRDFLGACKGRGVRGAVPGCCLEGDRDRAVVAEPLCRIVLAFLELLEGTGSSCSTPCISPSS